MVTFLLSAITQKLNVSFSLKRYNAFGADLCHYPVTPPEQGASGLAGQLLPPPPLVRGGGTAARGTSGEWEGVTSLLSNLTPLLITLPQVILVNHIRPPTAYSPVSFPSLPLSPPIVFF